MFLVLIKYVRKTHTSWDVDGDPFDTLADAVNWARDRAEEFPNIFAVVEVDRMYQRVIRVTEVEVAP